MCVAKDLTNRLTDMVLLSFEDLIGQGKVYNYFGKGTSTLPREIVPRKKNDLPQHCFFLLLLNLKLKVLLEASFCVAKNVNNKLTFTY